jgi:hypothetical protein
LPDDLSPARSDTFSVGRSDVLSGARSDDFVFGVGRDAVAALRAGRDGGTRGTGRGNAPVALRVAGRAMAPVADFAALDVRRDAGLSFFTRTGLRSMNTHPTFGTGLPPMSRPASNNHPYTSWNSW